MTDWGTPDSLPTPRDRRRAESTTDAAVAPSAPYRLAASAVDPAAATDAQTGLAGAKQRARADLRGIVGTWASVSVITSGVWLATGADGPFWPVWPILGVGIGVVSKANTLWRVSGATDEAAALEVRRGRRGC